MTFQVGDVVVVTSKAFPPFYGALGLVVGRTPRDAYPYGVKVGRDIFDWRANELVFLSRLGKGAGE